MYERAWPRWLWSYVVGPQTYILTTPGVRGENGSFLRERVLYNRRTMVAAVASTGPALLRPWPAPAGMRSFSSRAVSPATQLICHAPMCTTPRADRSAEDRRLRKAEAVGSNPTRSTLRRAIRAASGRIKRDARRILRRRRLPRRPERRTTGRHIRLARRTDRRTGPTDAATRRTPGMRLC